jgi:hypothetical protein
MASAFDPLEAVRETTRAPAAAAFSAVASSDPSSTTMTSPAHEHARHAATTSATVDSSLRAGMTTSRVSCSV